MLINTAIFKKILGKACSVPVQKCEHGLYKGLLLEAVRKTCVNPQLGVIEYTEDLVYAMNLEYLEKTEDSLGKLLKEPREIFNEWKRSE